MLLNEVDILGRVSEILDERQTLRCINFLRFNPDPGDISIHVRHPVYGGYSTDQNRFVPLEARTEQYIVRLGEKDAGGNHFTFLVDRKEMRIVLQSAPGIPDDAFSLVR